MIHLDEHPHAFCLDGTVILVAAFAEHNEPLIKAVGQAHGADEAICCCNTGQIPAPGWTWDGQAFHEPQAEETTDGPTDL